MIVPGSVTTIQRSHVISILIIVIIICSSLKSGSLHLLLFKQSDDNDYDDDDNDDVYEVHGSSTPLQPLASAQIGF